MGVPITTPEQLTRAEGAVRALSGVQMIWLSYLTEPDFEKEDMGEAAVSAAQQRLHTALGQDVLGSGITVRDARTALEVTFLFDTPEMRARAEEALGPDVAPLARYEGMVRPA